jgi:hypothetical protein
MESTSFAAKQDSAESNSTIHTSLVDCSHAPSMIRTVYGSHVQTD